MTRGATGTGTLPYTHGAGRFAALTLIFGSLLASHLDAESAEAAAAGMVVNSGNASVTVFDQNTHAVLGSVTIGAGAFLDCSFDGESNLGYVGDFATHIWAIDAGAGPPAVATGLNPINSGIATEDTEIARRR